MEVIPHIVNFLTLIKADAAGGEVRDFRLKQCAFDIRQMGAAPDEDGDVAVLNPTQLFVVFIPDLESFRNQAFDALGDEFILIDGIVALLAENNLDFALRFWRISTHFCRRRTALDELLICNLKFAFIAIIHQTVKKNIDESDDIAKRTEIFLHADGCALHHFHLLAGLVENPNVGTAEPVNALFRIADDEQICGVEIVCQEHHELFLQRVDVLILVHHEVSVACLHPLSNFRVVFEQITEFELQVWVVQLALREFGVPICPLYPRIKVEDVAGGVNEETVVVAQHLFKSFRG